MIYFDILSFSRFSDFVPAHAADYCSKLQETYRFDFTPSRPRKTRLGDFTSRPGMRPLITVNFNLNPYSFLVTYLHEVAHCVVYRKYKRKVRPHGKEWKASFRELLQPVIVAGYLPPDVLTALKTYAINPKATTSGDQHLAFALNQWDSSEGKGDKKTLRHLKEGALFVLNGRGFERGPLRRTRILCTELSSRRKYTIAAHALVDEQI